MTHAVNLMYGSGHTQHHHQMKGGSFFSKIADAAGSAAKGAMALKNSGLIGNVANAAAAFHPGAAKVAALAKMVGASKRKQMGGRRKRR